MTLSVGSKQPAPTRRALLRAAAALGAASPLVRISAAAGATSPKRFVVFWVPEGVPYRDTSASGDQWWPDYGKPFPAGSKPLEELKANLLFARGLGWIKTADIHVDGPPNLLTGDLSGAPTRTANGVTIPGGMSLNLALAELLSKGTVWKHYGLGVLNHVEGVATKRRITYRKDGDGVDPQNNPLAAYNDLLANAAKPPANAGGSTPTLSPAIRRLMARKSVLDDVTKELANLRCGLGRDGQLKLDAYADSIRDVETQLTKQIDGAKQAAPSPVLTPPMLTVGADKGNEGGFWGDPNKTPDITRLQMDIAASALAADATRVVTLQINQSVSRQKYPWLPVAQKDRVGHSYAHVHDESTGDKVAGARDRVTIMAWYAEQYAYFLKKLRSIPNGLGGSLLDDTMVLYCSEMGNGRHLPNDQPFILGGSAGGVFKQGGVVNATANVAGLRNVQFIRHYEIESNVRMRNDLLVAIAQGYGMKELSALGRDDRNGRPLTEILT